MEHHKGASIAWNNCLWLLALAVFVFIPGYFFVIGRDNGSFDRLWFLDPEQRVRYSAITKRMFVWFCAAGLFGVIWSLPLTYVVNRP
jgi:hypothetical protein